MPPLRSGTPDQFRAVRALFAAARYTTEEVCARTGSTTIYDFKTLREGRPGPATVEDALDALIRLFMDAEPVGRDRLRETLPDGGPEALDALGLLGAHPRDAEAGTATVLLYPTESLHIASDLEYEPAPSDGDDSLRTDAVYPAITRSTQMYLSILPTTPCERFLELCAGTGITALLAASRYARHAVAVDITERSTEFARFNARLNGIDNVTALQGDLYEPVAGRTFDRIVAHPPYMPAPEQKYIFRDGGADGEQITRRILGGLADHLEPGGRLCCTMVATDRKGAPVERRLREMLGEREAEFDLVVVTTPGYDPAEHYARLAARGRVPIAEAQQRIQLYARLEAEQIVGCSIVVRRHASARPAITVRRQRGEATHGAEVDWLLDWEAAGTDAGVVDELLAARPVVSPFARLTLVHRPGEGSWVPEACTVVTEYPFPLTITASLEAATFLAQCDGSLSVREHLKQLREAGTIPRSTTDAEFAGLVRSLVGSGMLQVEALPLPAGSGA